MDVFPDTNQKQLLFSKVYLLWNTEQERILSCKEYLAVINGQYNIVRNPGSENNADIPEKTVSLRFGGFLHIDGASITVRWKPDGSA